jgi:hypothetical protein
VPHFIIIREGVYFRESIPSNLFKMSKNPNLIVYSNISNKNVSITIIFPFIFFPNLLKYTTKANSCDVKHFRKLEVGSDLQIFKNPAVELREFIDPRWQHTSYCACSVVFPTPESPISSSSVSSTLDVVEVSFVSLLICKIVHFTVLFVIFAIPQLASNHC